MEEELDEFEVLWPDTDHADDESLPPAPAQPTEPPPRVLKQRWCVAGSRPVDVPVRGTRLQRLKDCGATEEDGHSGGKIGKLLVVPPHLLLLFGSMRRPEEEETAVAATLPALGTRPCKRARELRHLRNSVLRMTGFIEG